MNHSNNNVAISDIPVYPKVWGEEHWIVNRAFCGKKLILRAGYRCSVHYHENKDETFFVISGLVLMELGDQVILLNPGDKIDVMPTLKHRFTGLKDSEIIEFSTHHDEEDSYRVEPSTKLSELDYSNLLAKYT